MENTQKIVEGLDALVNLCHDSAYYAGWWTDLNTGTCLRDEVRIGTRLGKALVAEKLCLIHSETSEAMEGHRKNLMDDKLPQYGMFETELADVLIRLADLIGATDKKLFSQIVIDKLMYNSTREDHKIENRMLDNGKAY